MYQTKLREKLKEALGAVMPIALIVLVLSLTIVPVPSGTLLTFLFGSLLLVIGMMFFTLGAELSMQPMGSRIGGALTGTRNMPLILAAGFVLGALITISEPDLQVLAGQVQSIPNSTLILSVSLGVGVFLVAAILRTLLQIRLSTLLMGLYALVFILAFFAPPDFLAVAFDAGGVTTGPMTVPFIMSFGVGIAAIRSDQTASEDSMGLIALCSVGPILTVLILSLIYQPESAAFSAQLVPDVSESVEMGRLFAAGFPSYIKEIARALLPIILVFAVYQIVFFKRGRQPLKKIAVGLIYTYVGLVLFLTGAGVGFMPAGYYIGGALANFTVPQIIIPVGMLMGWFIVKAEPAVYVLKKQVEEMTSGAVSGGMLETSLSLGVAASVGLSMIRVLTGLNILWFLLPGYGLALALSFFVPKIFTAIAFDSGGVASGPMTAAFLLPFAMGACAGVGGNVITDAFGVVAMVAMTPLITIQLLGVFYRLREGRRGPAGPAAEELFAELDNSAIIEL